MLKVSKEITHTLTWESGFQVLMKICCSNGLQVQAYHGNFLQKISIGDLEIGIIDADKTISIIFSYDGKLDTKLDAHFQSALLYTTVTGQRRVHVQNMLSQL